MSHWHSWPLRCARYVLRWPTRSGRRGAVQYLDLLAVALEQRGWSLVRYYRPTEFPAAFPLLRVYSSAEHSNVGVAVTVRTSQYNAWSYFTVGQGQPELLIVCGDAEAAADLIDDRLKQQMSRHTSGQRS